MAAPTVRGRTTFGAGLSVTSPVGTLIGDMVMVVSWETRANATPPTHTIVSTYVEIISNGDYTETGESGRLSVAYKIATADGANAYAAYTSSDGTTVRTCCIVFTKDTFSASATVKGATASAKVASTTNGAPDPPSVTLAATRDWLVVAIGGWCFASSTACTATIMANYSNLQQYTTAGLASAATAERALTAPASENPATYTDNATPTGTAAVTIGIAAPFVAPSQDATLTGTPAVVKTTGKPVAVALTGTAAIVKSTLKPVAAALTGTVAIVTSHVTNLLIAVTMTLTPAVVRVTNKVVSAAMTGTAAVAKVTAKTVAAALTGTAAVARITGRAVEAAATLTASVARSTGKAVAAALTATPAVAKSIAKTIAASLIATPLVVRSTAKTIAASLTAGADVARTTYKAIAVGMTSIVETAGDFIAGVGGILYEQLIEVTTTLSVSVSKTTNKLVEVGVSLVASVAGVLVGVFRWTQRYVAPWFASPPTDDGDTWPPPEEKPEWKA